MFLRHVIDQTIRNLQNGDIKKLLWAYESDNRYVPALARSIQVFYWMAILQSIAFIVNFKINGSLNIASFTALFCSASLCCVVYFRGKAEKEAANISNARRIARQQLSEKYQRLSWRLYDLSANGKISKEQRIAMDNRLWEDFEASIDCRDLLIMDDYDLVMHITILTSNLLPPDNRWISEQYEEAARLDSESDDSL